MVVRAAKSQAARGGDHRSMLRVVLPIRMVTLPIVCTPVAIEWIPARYLVRGVYEWEKGFLVVAHIENILG